MALCFDNVTTYGRLQIVHFAPKVGQMAANTLDLRCAAVGYDIAQLVSHSRQQWWRDKAGGGGGWWGGGGNGLVATGPAAARSGTDDRRAD